jgi:hypothetical protein
MSLEVVLVAADDNRVQLQEGASIAGVVVDERGQALLRFRIGIESYRPSRGAPSAGRRGESRSVDDPEGRFQIDGLSPGRYVLTASASGRPPVHSASVELRDGETVRGLRIELPLGGGMFGRVLDAASREPIAGARVALDAATMTGANAIAASRSDPRGGYRLDGVPKGPFSLKIDAAGFQARVVAGLRSEPGRDVEHDFELQPASPAQAGTEYSGVGMLLAATPRGVMVGSVFTGGPAERAGLQMRDVVVRIDGEDVRELSVPDCVQRLRGPVGTRVSITVEREGSGRIAVVLDREKFVR